MAYKATQVLDSSPEAVAAWAYREFLSIERSFFDLDFIQVKELHVEPSKPRAGMVVLADGSDWDPGGGQGFYGYYGGAWNKLG